MLKLQKITSVVLAGAMAISMLSGFTFAPKAQVAATKTKITVWSHLTKNEVTALKPIIEKWGNENNVSTTVRYVPDQETMQTYLTAAQSSKGPDLYFGLAHDNLGTFEKADLLAPVPDGLFKDTDFLSTAIANPGTYGGKKYAVPLSFETYALLYNKDKVATAPTTMDDFIATAKKPGVGFEYDINNFYFSYGFIAAYGGYVFKNVNGSFDPTDIGLGNNHGAAAGYQFLSDLVNKEKLMKGTIKDDVAKADFLTGKTAFYISGPWAIADCVKAKLNFGVAPLPKINGKATPSFMGIQAAFVSSKSKNQDLAFKLLKYLESDNVQLNVLVAQGNRMPALRTAYNSATVQANQYVKGFGEQAKNAQIMPNIAEMQAVWTPAGNNLVLCNTGKITSVKAASEIATQIKDGISKMGK